MNTRDQLQSYLRTLEARLKVLVISRGLAITAGVALGATLALVLLTNAFAFSSISVAWSRVVLFLSLAIAVGLAVALPWMRLSRPRAAKRAEQKFPEFEQRLLTFVERDSELFLRDSDD